MTHKICDLTGPGTSSMQFGVYGTDLLIPCVQPDGLVSFTGGDTFNEPNLRGDWRSPILLRAEVQDIHQPIRFINAAGGRYAKQLLQYRHGDFTETTRLPTDVITINDRMYMHYMVIGTGGLKDCRWTGMAMSTDNGENWIPVGTRWEGNEFGGMRQMSSMCDWGDGYVYVMTARGLARNSNIILFRVRRDQLGDRNSYQSWGFKNGTWAWGNPPSPILPHGEEVGEFCLRKVEDQCVLMYMKANGPSGVVVKVGDHPLADWTKARTIMPVHNTMWGRENGSNVAQLYGPYILPGSKLDDMSMVLSQWNTTPGAANWPYRAMLFGGINTFSAPHGQNGIAPIDPIAAVRDFFNRFIPRR